MTINRSQIGGLFFLVLFISYGINASSVPLDFLSEQDTFNARTLPISISVAGSFVSLLLIILSGKPHGNGESAGANGLRGANWLATVLLVFLMFLYGLVLDYLGFIIATTAFLVAGYWVMGERQPGVLLLASLPVVLGIWLVMTGLGVYLVPGDLYYEIMGN